MLNVSFGTRIWRGSKRPHDYFPDARPNNRWLVCLGILLIFTFLGIGRLAELQLIKGDYYRSLAEGNRIRRIPLKAPRGEILARDRAALARNVPVYKLATFNESGIVKETKTISRDEAIRLQAEGGDEANRVLIDVGRTYPLGASAAHVVGYVNEANEGEVENNIYCDTKSLLTTDYRLQFIYQLGDLVGRAGIEAYYDCILRGVNGEELIEVDARGKLVRKLGRREPIPGQTITLTLDPKLQQTVYEALLATPNEKGSAPRIESGQVVRGSVVVEDPTNGEILAIVSAPSFDPTSLSNNYSNLVQDKNLPFFNRASGGAYHPGSTFKLVTSTAALETGAIDRDYKYEDPGIVKLGNATFRNWLYIKNGRTEGVIDIVRAITRSTDTFFYILGEKVGITRLAEWASAFNLGRKTGIDLPAEAAGLVPTPEWKEKTTGERWYLGNTYNVSIGQGDLAASPLQINAMVSAVATNKWCKPHLLKEVSSFKFQVISCRDMGLKEETLHLIKAGMIGVCSPGGTAGVFFNFTPNGNRVACKTGTAQVGTGPVGARTHAWFTSYALVATDSTEVVPQISVTALVEEGGEGSIVAAPVVKKIMEEWFISKKD